MQAHSKEEAVAQLEALDTDADNMEQTAMLHLHIWKIDGSATNKKESLDLYQKLYTKKPSHFYKKELNILKT